MAQARARRSARSSSAGSWSAGSRPPPCASMPSLLALKGLCAAAANSSIAAARRAARSAPGCAAGPTRPSFEHILELYLLADCRAWQIGGSAGCLSRARRSSGVTLDVKFLVWITYGSRDSSSTVKKSCMHSLGRTFAQARAAASDCQEPFPQSCPQAAHSAGGVSAQPVHRPVHTMTRRFARHAEDCRRRSIEQGGAGNGRCLIGGCCGSRIGVIGRWLVLFHRARR